MGLLGKPRKDVPVLECSLGTMLSASSGMGVGGSVCLFGGLVGAQVTVAMVTVAMVPWLFLLAWLLWLCPEGRVVSLSKKSCHQVQT